MDPDGDADTALEELPGEMGENGQKTLPDGSVAGVHTSSGRSGGKPDENTGSKTLHINQPSGKGDVKIRYPEKLPEI